MKIAKKNIQEESICFVGLGSNLGDSRTILQQAWQELTRFEGVSTKALSSPYCTSPVGMESENMFVNAVGMLHAKMSPHKLLSALLQIEDEFGRMRQQGTAYQDRILDLDLLYYGDRCLKSEQLVLPHPHLSERLFVLTPIVEIAQEWRDPKSRLTVCEMKKRLKNRLNLEKSVDQVIDKISWRD